MTYLVDTDIIIYWLKGNSCIEQTALDVGLENISFSIISKAELFFGAYKSTYVKQNLDSISVLSQKIVLLPFDELAAEHFGRIKNFLRQAGIILADADIMIASIALANNLTLITNNTKHFSRINDLKVSNWMLKEG
ncbi:VapC toxin protein [hydrothermal vent metagenome]|uniref:VapC toxin protein n=1 Tax=hydrothermal vent metagenome TaxID=652676 RepID=A0A3B1DXF7_9ZZZZ